MIDATPIADLPMFIEEGPRSTSSSSSSPISTDTNSQNTGSITRSRRGTDEAAGDAANTTRQQASPKPKLLTVQNEALRKDILNLEKGSKGGELNEVEAKQCVPMPRLLIIDSGAAETVMPRDWFRSHPLMATEASRNGEFFITADGTEIENEGARRLTLCTPDWQNVRNMEFQVTDVNKALGSVSKMVRNGNRVVFDAMGSYIENTQTAERIWLREDNGVYVLDVLVAPANQSQASNSPVDPPRGFGGQR